MIGEFPTHRIAFYCTYKRRTRGLPAVFAGPQRAQATGIVILRDRVKALMVWVE